MRGAGLLAVVSSPPRLGTFLDGLRSAGLWEQRSQCRGHYEKSWRKNEEGGEELWTHFPDAFLEVQVCWTLLCGACISYFEGQFA